MSTIENSSLLPDVATLVPICVLSQHTLVENTYVHALHADWLSQMLQHS